MHRPERVGHLNAPTLRAWFTEMHGKRRDASCWIHNGVSCSAMQTCAPCTDAAHCKPLGSIAAHGVQ